MLYSSCCYAPVIDYADNITAVCSACNDSCSMIDNRDFEAIKTHAAISAKIDQELASMTRIANDRERSVNEKA